MAKSRTVTGAGLLTAFVLVLLFGNPPVVEWIPKHVDQGSFLGWFLKILTWPSWQFLPADNTANGWRSLLAADLKAILLLAFVAVILSWVAKGVTSGGAAFLLGWASLVFAAGLAGFLTNFILSNPTFIGALTAGAAGAAYGLYAGWIVGIVTSSAKRGGS
jgi:hypothetical protein